MRNDRGNVSIAMLALAAVVAMLILGLGDLAVFLLARAKAQTAADAAALAAASEQVPGLGQDPIGQARRLAKANGADLTGCACRRAANGATVQVEIPVRFAVIGALGVQTVIGRARAEVDIKGLSPV